MRISSQLLLAMTVTTLLAVGATSYAAIKIASNSLEQSYFEKLSLLADMQANQIARTLKRLDQSLIGDGPINSSVLPIIHNQIGLGDTGEVLLIDADGKVMARSGNPDAGQPGNGKIDLSSIEFAKNGDISTGIIMLPHNTTPQVSSLVSSLVSVANINSGNLNWKIVATIDRNEALAGVTTMTQWIAAITLLALMGILSFTLWFAKSLARPIIAVTHSMQTLTTDNTNFVLFEHDRKDELGAMIRSVNAFRLATLAKAHMDQGEQAGTDYTDEDPAIQANSLKNTAEIMKYADTSSYGKSSDDWDEL